MWIEISKLGYSGVVPRIVTPFAGVWIEIPPACVSSYALGVTPFAGVWIEINRVRSVTV